jgi:predicted hydrocarbon binding protein
MFKEERTESMFDWNMLGDISEGRPNLGPSMSVLVYRLMQFTLRDVLIQKYGVEATDRIFYEAGEAAGRSLYQNVITKKDNIEEFITELQQVLKDLQIGLLRVEAADFKALTFTLTVAEDLDCSGLPMCEEEICTYDEGFIQGLLSSHTGKNFRVKEIDCWCSGDRVCRFDVRSVA